jgi:hypothetical protein
MNDDPQPLKEEPTMVVEFLIHKSLPDKNPIFVQREHAFSKRSLMASDPIQRCSVKPRVRKKLCGTLAVTRAKSV